MDDNFNILEFEKRLEANPEAGVFRDQDDNLIQQFGDRESGFVEKITAPSGYFTTYKKYFPSGDLEEVSEIYTNGQFKKGLWKKFDQNGEVEESVQHDEPFKYTFENVLDYTRTHSIDLKARGSELHRELDEDDNPFWYLSWNSGELQGVEYIIKNVEINGLTGEVVDLGDSRWEDN